MSTHRAIVALVTVIWLADALPAEKQKRKGRPGQYVKKDLAPIVPGKTPSKEAALAGQQEFRRRGGRCMNSRVYAPAQREARVPKNLGRVPVVQPRLRLRAGRLTAFSLSDETLWAADDQALYQAHVPTARLVRTFGRSEGLPDDTVQELAVSDDGVWLATFSGLAKLDPETGRIASVPDVRFTVGSLAAGESGTWVMSDSATFHLPPGGEQWIKVPDFPGQSRLTASVRAGFWLFRWHHREISLVASCFVTPSGLGVLHERRLYHCDGRGQWRTLASGVWQAIADGDQVWALATDGVLGIDLASGQSTLHRYGQGPAEGRPVAIVLVENALFLASHGNYETKAREFKGFNGGGISRLDLATGKWTVTDKIGETSVQFVDSLFAEGRDVWAGVMLYDKPIQRGAHPGMAHVKRWLPHPSGIGLARFADGSWSIQTGLDLKTDHRWMAPHGKGVYLDTLGPQNVEMMCRTGSRLWGVCRIVPEHWYGGYTLSVGSLAERKGDGWQAGIKLRTSEFALGGEHPALLGISRSHGGVYLAEGHARVLGIRTVGDRCCVISQTGVFVHDPATDRFQCVVREPDRLYFRATCGVPTADSVWFGGDGGTVSRLDRKTGRLALAGVVPGRTVTGIGAKGDRVVVTTRPGKATLPVSLADAPSLPEADVLVWDGQQWAGGSEADLKDVPVKGTPSLACRFKGGHRDVAKRQDNYLDRDGKPVAYLRGVFRPQALCDDAEAGLLWLATYAGIASVPLDLGGAR